MEEFDLGPNGAMLYCLDYLEKNVDWLMERLEGLNKKYLIFDFPGQVCVCVSACLLRQEHMIHGSRYRKQQFRQQFQQYQQYLQRKRAQQY